MGLQFEALHIKKVNKFFCKSPNLVFLKHFWVSLHTSKMGKDYLGKDMRRGNVAEDEKEEKEIKSLDEGDIALLKTYGQGPYSKSLKQVETDIADTIKRVNELAGIKASHLIY